MAGRCKFSCETATQTLEWIHAIVDFITPYSFLINAHLVNFFQDRLWEAVDKEWIDCLRKESVENLLLIPYGVVQDHWPASLKNFVVTLRSLVLPREQADLQMVYPRLHMTSLNSVVTQGMNLKKKHEVENLSAVVSSIANSVRANTVVDVGSGQGYLAQVLSFEYHHSVVAIDACSHHGRVTDARAERIKKYYAAQLRKSDSGIKSLNVPKTITCRVMSVDMLKSLTDKSANDDDDDVQQIESIALEREKLDSGKPQSCNMENEVSIVLAGLHACGDLSVTMLKTFSECKNVKAVVSIGCCYNLLSEQYSESGDSQCGFPLSCGVKSAGIVLGKNSRDLACQSAERWKSLGKEAGLHNFELHAFRSAFQMVLCKYYPEVVVASPSIGRQGKALHRQQQRRVLESSLHHEENTFLTLSQNQSNKRGNWPTMTHEENKADDTANRVLEKDGLLHEKSSNGINESDRTKVIDKFSQFEKFCQSGLCRLGLKPLQDVDLLGIWKKADPYNELVGPYWSLRAAFGPLLETLLLLDRLLFLQEQGTSFEVVMLPIFDPTLSPRNMAVIAKRKTVETNLVR